MRIRDGLKCQQALQRQLRYTFQNTKLLQQALTHRSYSATHNERLEFLGDSVLNFAVAALLFQRFSTLNEGNLSRMRAHLVKQQSLYEIAHSLNLAKYVRVSEGEFKTGGCQRPSILANTLEAIVGAIYLDGGFDHALKVIEQLYAPIISHIDPNTVDKDANKDAKTLLQEYLQRRKIALPHYTVIATHGAAHNQQFEVQCVVPKYNISVFGSGTSRRTAEQVAAKLALARVQKQKHRNIAHKLSHFSNERQHGDCADSTRRTASGQRQRDNLMKNALEGNSLVTVSVGCPRPANAKKDNNDNKWISAEGDK